MKPLFYKKIRCIHCGGNLKKKLERGITKYICRNYDSLGTCKKRIPIHEEFLKETINKHYGYELSDEEIRDKVVEILVEDRLLFEIKLKDSESIIFGKKFIRY